MMLTILGLPPKFKFPDVKLLIKQECNISEFILDNLETDDDGSKKVRVGVADGDEGYILIKCLDRFRLPGNFVLTVVPVGKQNTFDQKPDFHNKPRSDYQSNQARGDFHSNKPKLEYHGNQSRDYQGNTPRGDYGGKPRMEQSGNHRIEYSANQARSEYQGNKPRTETGADFHSNKQRDGIGQTQGNTSRDYPGNKQRVEFQGSQVRSDYHGNQPREFQGVHRNDYQAAPKDDFPGNKARSEFQSSSSRDYQGNQSREFQNNRYGNQGPPVARDHPSPWSTNAGAGSNQWGTAMNTQVPQNSFGYQQPGHQIQPFAKQPVPVNRSEARPPQARGSQQEPQPGFGFSPKSNDTQRVGRNDNRAHALRSVEISETPINAAAQQGRYPPNAPYPRTDKPVTIMKDNFQGPTQYNIGSNQHGQYQGQAPIQPWGSSTPKPFSKSNPVQYDKPYVDDRKFPTDRARIKAPNEPISVTEAYPDKSRFSPQRESHGRRHSLDRRFSPAKYPRRMSPSGRDMPVGRRISPSGRDMQAGRRMSPSGRDMQAARRMSPSSRDMPAGRRLSPSARDMPAGRQTSPSGRNMPTGTRMSPLGRDILTRRLMSPSGRDVQSRRRISPSSRDVITDRQVPTGGHGSPSGRNIMGRRLMSPSRRLVSPIGERGSLGRIVVKTGRDMTIAGRRISPGGMRITPGDRSRELGRSGARQLQSPPRDSPPRQHPRYSPGRHSFKQTDNFGDGSKSKQVRPAYEPPQQAAQNMYSGYRGGHEAGQYPRERNSWHRDRENREEPRRSHPSPHKSRSPNRYKRQSPSPLSPRRSWALEKRASPDAPPPPMWPVADRAPEWIRPKQDDRPRPRPNPHYQDVDRDCRLDAPRNQKQDRQDLRDYRDERRRESPRDEPKLPLRDEINRDFVNIYKKTLEFKKRAQEHRSKSGERRREGGEERRERRESPRLDRPNVVDWRLEEPETKRSVVNPARNTRERAVDELATKILAKHTYCDSFNIEQKLRVKEELKLAISRRVAEMFGNHDVTFIEIIIKYQGRYDERDEQRMMREVLSSLPSQYRPLKRSAPESSEIPAKSSRWSADTDKPEAPKLQRVKTRPNRIEAKPPVIAKPAKPKVEFKPPERVASVKPDNDNTIAEAIEAEMVAHVKPQGHYELNALMTRAVVAELQDIMIKIWQELPDDPPNEAEKEVVEALRNTAGDDLRNVLGLNITKRLLNVYNPLFVKVQFSGKPVREHLSRFLRKYNFVAFKRIDKVDIFAARMRSINDFDRICIDKNIRCGDIEVTVTPCYRFTKCPPNLKTIFSDSAELNEETSVKAENIPQGKQNKPIDKTKTLVNPKANVSKATSTTPHNVKVETKATPTKSCAKPSAVAASDTKTATPNLKVIKTEPVGVKVEANPATSTNSTLIKAPSTVKLERYIEAQPNAIAAAGKVNSTAATKIKTLSNTVAVKPKSTEVNKQRKGKKAIESQSIKKIGDVTHCEPGDFDELDDKEILALLSGGIVLDECSGSDEE